MARKLIWIAVMTIGSAALSHAEQMRPLLSKENKFPELRHAEISVIGGFTEITDPGETFSNAETNLWTVAGQVRFRVAEPVTFLATVPFESVDSDFGDTASGIGDVELGLEFLAYQDIFDYPWVIPHISFSLDTGDSDEGIGLGESVVDIGVAVGSTAKEVVHFVGDLKYRIFETSENIVAVAGAIIWDISDQFSVLGEIQVSDEDENDGNDNPVIVLGGMSYRASEHFTLTVNGGGGKNTREDVLVNVKATVGL